MEVTQYKDAEGHWNKEIIGHSYQGLKSLGDEYAARGCKIWINNYLPGQWMLTVQEPRGGLHVRAAV